MNFLKPIAAVSVVAALGALALQVRAGGEKVVFPEGFEKSVLYATVDRHDVKRVHELFSAKAAVDAVRNGQPIPSGTVLINVQYHAQLDENGVPLKGPDGRFVKGSLFGYGVMEKRTGWGAEYPADFRNGE